MYVRSKGFTLVELLAVLVILAVILVIAVPKVMDIIKVTRISTLESTAKLVALSAEKKKVENEIVGNNEILTCENVVKINDIDYESCYIEFIDNKAVVTIIGSGTFKGMNACEATKTNANVTERCLNKKVEVTLELNGGSGLDITGVYKEGTILDLEEPIKENSTFTSYEIVSGNSVITNNKLTVGSTNTIIHAVYEIWPSLEIDLDGGNDNTDYKEKYKSGSIIELEVPTKTGYIFTGWIKESGNSVLSGNTLTMGSEDTIIKANFRKQEDLEIINVKIDSEESSARQLSSNYNINKMSTSIELPNINSKITYKVTIANIGSLEMVLSNIIGLQENLEYSFSNYFLNDKLCDENNKCNLGITKDIYITIKYKNGKFDASNTLYNLDLSFEFKKFDNTVILDKSGNNYKLNVVGATWDYTNGFISIDGIDDYLYIENLHWNNTTEFTIDFVAKISNLNMETPNILFESSLDSNKNYGAFYIDTHEYGINDITLAMKYIDETNQLRNHKMVDNIIENYKFVHYTITFNSLNEYDNFTKIYKDGIYYHPDTITPSDTQKVGEYAGNISGKTLNDYSFYIGAREGNNYFSKMDLKEIRIYKKELSSEEVMLNHKGNIVTDNLLVYYNFK